MFVKTTKELQKYIAVDGDLSIDVISTFIRKAESRWLNKYFALKEIEELQIAYDEQNLSPVQFKVVDLINEIVLHDALFLGLPFLNANISGSGIKRTNIANKEEKEVSLNQKEVQELQNLNLESAYFGISELLKFLETQAHEYKFWKNSPTYLKSKRLFVANETAFSEIQNLGGSVYTYFQMVNFLEEVEENTIKNCLGNSLFEEVKSQFLAQKLYPKYETIISLIQRITVYMALAQAFRTLPVQSTGNGIQILACGIYDASQKASLIDNFADLGRKYLSDLEKHLRTNRDFLPLLPKEAKFEQTQFDKNTKSYII